MAGLPVLPNHQFSEVTEDNHAGVVWIVALLCLVYSMLTFVTRGAIKWTLLGMDDWALVAAQVAAIAQYCALFVSLHKGLGRTLSLLSDLQRQEFSRAAYGNAILVLLSLCLSKCSLIFLIRRVFTRDMKNFWFICNLFLGIVAVWGLAAIITVTAGCSSSHYVPPTGPGMCPGYLTRWKFVVAFDVATEVIFVVLPIYLLWNLQMAFKLKLRVFLAFAFRIP
ncbi:hypothetical protein AOQ84DRAFT_374814 [Glonium stellatum]|uniref:Rhodopsin domain-containing protein n=1 Tax=Glonium stellatum TaxID=574774 RepID=A0A8E2F4S0_9PEZI|nr:hypothetical protein AOQ84DRAFT_374814 [Glonium stellatum]